MKKRRLEKAQKKVAAEMFRVLDILVNSEVPKVSKPARLTRRERFAVETRGTKEGDVNASTAPRARQID